MKLNNMSDSLTYLLREEPLELVWWSGSAISHMRMGVMVRHRVRRKNNVLKTQISVLKLRQVVKPDVQAGRGQETVCMGQKT